MDNKKIYFYDLTSFWADKTLKNEKSLSEIMEITTLGKSPIYKILKYLDENVNGNFEDYKNQNGRKKTIIPRKKIF